MWKFYVSASNKNNWPSNINKEVCLIGRSNVGKSSLINALAKSKIARTSNTPGRTQLLNFFNFKNAFLVDLPGYGYAKMPAKIHDQVLKMVEQYLEQRVQLVCVFILIDAKIGPTKDDYLIIDFLKKNKRRFFIIATKSDKCNQSEYFHSRKKIEQITNDFLYVSSFKRKNIGKFDKILMSNF